MMEQTLSRSQTLSQEQGAPFPTQEPVTDTDEINIVRGNNTADQQTTPNSEVLDSAMDNLSERAKNDVLLVIAEAQAKIRILTQGYADLADTLGAHSHSGATVFEEKVLDALVNHKASEQGLNEQLLTELRSTQQLLEQSRGELYRRNRNLRDRQLKLTVALRDLSTEERRSASAAKMFDKIELIKEILGEDREIVPPTRILPTTDEMKTFEARLRDDELAPETTSPARGINLRGLRDISARLIGIAPNDK